MVRLISLSGFITVAAAATLSIRDTSCNSGPITVNGRQCTVECGTDHPGGDYSALSVPDFQTCINACSSDANCETAQYLTTNSYCYLKNLVGTGSANSDVNSIVCQDSSSVSSSTTTTTTTTTTSSAVPPPAAPSSTTSGCTAGPTTINGRTGTIECNADRPGGDYSAISAPTFQACENACAADVNCLTAQYNSDTQYCYLKSAIHPPSLQSDIWGIVFSTTVTSQTTSTSTSTSTTLSTATSTTSSSSTIPQTTTSPSITPIPTSTTTTSASPTCSAGYVTLNNRQAVRQCQFDYPGGDYKNQYTGTMPPCESLCAADPTCVVAVFDSGSGVCYLKSGANAPQFKGSVSAIKFPQATTTSPGAGCYTTAPDSPYLLNGGIEQGLKYITQQSNDYGGLSPSGTFYVGGTGPNFEGCNAIYAYPTNGGNTPRLVLGQLFFNLQAGVRYTASFILGGIPAANTYTAPMYYVYTGGKQFAAGSVCGWTNSSDCPLVGYGYARGQLISADFIYQPGPYADAITLLVAWSGPNSNPIIMDDLRINLSNNTSPISVTTTTIISQSATHTINPAATSCVATYTTINGRPAAVQCGVDRTGGDLTNQTVASLPDCEAACAANPQCVAAEYKSPFPNNGGTCFLKSAINTPTHTSNAYGVVFYSTATSSASSPTGTSLGCLPSAPPSPYLINGGLEYPYMDENSAGLWSGSGYENITYGQAFEGCRAVSWTETSNSSQPRQLSFGPQYQGLKNGVTYNLTFIAGRTTPNVDNFIPPTLLVFADGQRMIGNRSVCGFTSTGPCTIVGTGGALGALVSMQFTAQNARSNYVQADYTDTVFVNITWNDPRSDGVNDQLIFDDFRLVPA